MFKVQILRDDSWKDLIYPLDPDQSNALNWEQALVRFTFYMNTWIDNDYRIVSV